MSPRAAGVALERDEAVAEGRAKQGSTVYYTVPGTLFTSSGTAALSAGRDTYTAWMARTPLVIDQLAAEVATAAGTNFRMGLYRADRDWQPFGAPLADSGDLDAATTGVKTYTPSTPINIRPGRYLSVTNSDGLVTWRRGTGSSFTGFILSAMGAAYLNGVTAIRAYGAFPTPPSAWTAASSGGTGGFHHIVFYRIVRP